MMLINTVILFLRDLLPFVILIVWLLSYIQPTFAHIGNVLVVTALSFAGIWLLFSLAPTLSEQFSGAGLEVIMVVLICVMLCSLLIGSAINIAQFRYVSHLKTRKQAWSHQLVNLGVVCLLIITGTQFLIYSSGYLSRTTNDLSIIYGVVVSSGIAISFSILLYFSLRWLSARKLFVLMNLLWAGFMAGLATRLVPLLSQIDVISDGSPLWSTSAVIKDSSEYGHILKALLGYEATPSLAFIIVYLGAITAFYLSLQVVNWSMSRLEQSISS